MDPTIPVGKRPLEGSGSPATKRRKERSNQTKNLFEKLNGILEEKVSAIRLIQEEMGRALAHEESSARWVQREMGERTQEISKLYDSYLGLVSQIEHKFEKGLPFPDEVWIRIFWHAAPQDFLTLRLVCKKFAHLTGDNSLNIQRNLALARKCLDAISSEEQVEFRHPETQKQLSVPLKRIGEYLFEFVSALSSYDVMSLIRESLNESREVPGQPQSDLKTALAILRDLGVEDLIDKKIKEEAISEVIELGEIIGGETLYDVLNKVAIDYAEKGKFREALETYEQLNKIKQQNGDTALFPCPELLMTLFYLEAQKTGSVRMWCANVCPEIDFARNPFQFFEFFEKTILTLSNSDIDYIGSKIQYVEALAFLAKNEIDQGNIEKGNAFFTYAKNFAVNPPSVSDDEDDEDQESLIIEPVPSLCRLARIWCSFAREDSHFSSYVAEAKECVEMAKTFTPDTEDWLEIAQAEFVIYTLNSHETTHEARSYELSFNEAKLLINSLMNLNKLPEYYLVLKYLKCQIEIGIPKETIQTSLDEIKAYFWKAKEWPTLLNIIKFEIQQEWIDKARLTAKLTHHIDGYLKLVKYYVSKNRIQKATKCLLEIKPTNVRNIVLEKAKIASAFEKENNLSEAHSLIRSLSHPFLKAGAFLSLIIPEYPLMGYAYEVLNGYQHRHTHFTKRLCEIEPRHD